jgi:hypothetical protein
MIAPLAKRLNRHRFLVAGIPNYSVYPRGSFSSIFCHSPHGQNPTAVRVRQQPLQSFHLARSAFLHGLHDPHLQSAHSLVGFSPVDRVPVHCLVGGCTSIICFHLLSLLGRFDNFSREERPWLSRGRRSGRRGSPFKPAPAHYRRAFAFSTFLCPPAHQLALRLPCLVRGGLTGLPRSA